jgi:hypothetical protein
MGKKEALEEEIKRLELKLEKLKSVEKWIRPLSDYSDE